MTGELVCQISRGNVALVFIDCYSNAVNLDSNIGYQEDVLYWLYLSLSFYFLLSISLHHHFSLSLSPSYHSIPLEVQMKLNLPLRTSFSFVLMSFVDEMGNKMDLFSG